MVRPIQPVRPMTAITTRIDCSNLRSFRIDIKISSSRNVGKQSRISHQPHDRQIEPAPGNSPPSTRPVSDHQRDRRGEETHRQRCAAPRRSCGWRTSRPISSVPEPVSPVRFLVGSCDNLKRAVGDRGENRPLSGLRHRLAVIGLVNARFSPPQTAQSAAAPATPQKIHRSSFRRTRNTITNTTGRNRRVKLKKLLDQKLRRVRRKQKRRKTGNTPLFHRPRQRADVHSRGAAPQSPESAAAESRSPRTTPGRQRKNGVAPPRKTSAVCLRRRS